MNEGARIKRHPTYDTEWMLFGLCRGEEVDINLFFPQTGSGNSRSVLQIQAQAQAICNECPVESDCLEYALKTRQEHGMWGGVSERERKRILKVRARNSRK